MGWTGEVPAWSHKPNHEGSNPSPATINNKDNGREKKISTREEG